MPERKQPPYSFRDSSQDDSQQRHRQKYSDMAASAATSRRSASSSAPRTVTSRDARLDSRAEQRSAARFRSQTRTTSRQAQRRRRSGTDTGPASAPGQRYSQRATKSPSAYLHELFAMRKSAEQEQGASSSLVGFIQKNLTYILSVVGVVLVVALGMVIFAPYLEGEISDELAEERYVSPYDWSKLERNNGHYAYVVNGEVRSRLGIDVSENQHEIDWDAAASDGIDFAMIRLGYRGATAGDLYLDERFLENMAGAQDAGIEKGIYFFSQAQTPEEAREEADFVLQNLQGIELDYPIAFDTEEKVLGISQARTHGLDTVEMTAIAEAFCERIEQAGYDAMIYGNRHDISRYKRSHMEKRDLWWAEYGLPAPTAKIDFVMWQYSNTGSVNGITGDVDMNIDLSHVLDQ